MKTILYFTSALAMFGLSSLPCHAQTPETIPPALNPATTQVENHQVLKFRKFQVPADFLSKGSPSTGDQSSSAEPTAKAVLESLGIAFDTPGSIASFYPRSALLVMTNTAEQLDNMDAVLSQTMIDTVLQGLVHLEVFSMPPLTARKALIAHPKENDLYTWIEAELVNPDSAVKLERHTITFVRGGQRAKTEGIDGIPRPTQFDPPTVPQSISLPVAAAAPAGNTDFATLPHPGPKPQSFAIRNTGDTFELELTFLDGLKSVDLNLAPETTRRVGIAKFGLREDVYQPIYETQKCSAQASGLIGQPMLVSTFSPPVNTGVPGGNKVESTWLLFVTVKEPE